VPWRDQPAGHADGHVKLVGLVGRRGFNTRSAATADVASTAARRHRWGRPSAVLARAATGG
jgi:hypothetical protein